MKTGEPIEARGFEPPASCAQGVARSPLIYLPVSRTCSEKPGADSDHRGALLNRDLEVVGHSHGEFRESQIGSHFSEPPEERASLLRVFDGRWHRHQTA